MIMVAHGSAATETESLDGPHRWRLWAVPGRRRSSTGPVRLRLGERLRDRLGAVVKPAGHCAVAV